MVRTEQLILIPSAPRLIDSEMEDLPALAQLLGADVPENWPPETMADALPWFREQIHRNPDAVGWFHWYVLADRPDTPKPVLAGSIGFIGPPGDDGTVEIGYAVLPQYQRRGIAREMTAALVRWAAADSRVARIAAETTPENVPSVRILEAVGFRCTGEGREPGSLRFERPLTGRDNPFRVPPRDI